MKIVIVGGVAGGASTAARLRRLDEDAQIIMFERGEYVSYANCGLPYYLGGTITDRERLFVQNPEKFKKNYNIEVRIRSEVEQIDREKKEITVKNLESGEEYSESYDKLVLSPGAEPIRPPIPGIKEEGIFTLRNVPDTDRIREFLDQKKPKRAVIVGAGYIGLEMAENLHNRGIFVTIVEMSDQVMNVLDYEMASLVHQHLKTKKVEFYLNDAVSSFNRRNNRLEVTLNSGKSLNTDLVILSIGVRPDSSLAKDAGLDTGERGGIVVDNFMATKDPDIYALGDAVEMANPITGIPGAIPLAGPANKQGRIVGDNIIFGNRKTFAGAIGTAIARVFDITVATTGVSEKALKKAGMNYTSSIIHSSAHAGYYPNAMPVTIKTIFNPDDGRLYGSQIVGYEGVDKRIDLFASVLRIGGSVFNLEELEHAYAPPYSSAKDPINYAGFVAENIVNGLSRHIHWKQLLEMDERKIFLLDVRTREENELGTIEGAVNIPMDEIRGRIDEIPRDKSIIVFCQVGLRGYQVERVLRQRGFEDIYNLSGGYKTYEFVTQKQSNEDIYDGEYIDIDDQIYQKTPSPKSEIIELDASGLQCPGPIMKLKQQIDQIDTGTQIREVATDPGFAKDVASWCNMTGNQLVDLKEEGATVTAVIEKAGGEPWTGAPAKQSGEPRSATGITTGKPVPTQEVTQVVFSDELDRGLATFVIANGAASSGKQVTLFFTFWGLNLLKKQNSPRVKKDFMGKMFGMMLPSHTGKLKLSKLNMGGMGSKMMRKRMKKLNIDSLEQMIHEAKKSGVRIVACRMSMDVMGVKEEELIDGIEIGGVAAYLEAAGTAGVNLFI
ncbi:MAG: FAD-dependent oxidoreductase [Spirochaetales bacterium]|nr:FAD-dependent oxidoreductase [Spirochaetales bacterium]MCF7937185.1 FAD-dependent oxidoreductase [Spirochaetales bacterium]